MVTNHNLILDVAERVWCGSMFLIVHTTSGEKYYLASNFVPKNDFSLSSLIYGIDITNIVTASNDANFEGNLMAFINTPFINFNIYGSSITHLSKT